MPSARILVAEDIGIVAFDVADTFERAGFTVVGPTGTLDKALALATSENFELAVLDVDLAGELSFPVAEVLARRGIPFFFTTAYGDCVLWPPQFKDKIVLSKPVNEAVMLRTARSLLQPDSSRAGKPVDGAVEIRLVSA